MPRGQRYRFEVRKRYYDIFSTERFALVRAMVPLKDKDGSGARKLVATIDASSSGAEQFSEAISSIV